MPKAKTRKSLTKRVRISKTGKVKISRAGKGHLLSKKSSKRRRHLRKKLIASRSDARRIKEMLGKARP
jgi:large subunit ribosomal protein L35